METVIRLEGLTKYYGKHLGIADLNLEVKAGEIFGYLGPNGAGKTTTIRMLLYLIRPAGGKATVLGLDAQTDSLPAQSWPRESIASKTGLHAPIVAQL